MTDREALAEELRQRHLDRAAEFQRRRAAQARLRATLAANRARGKVAHHHRRLNGGQHGRQ